MTVTHKIATMCAMALAGAALAAGPANAQVAKPKIQMGKLTGLCTYNAATNTAFCPTEPPDPCRMAGAPDFCFTWKIGTPIDAPVMKIERPPLPGPIGPVGPLGG